MLFIILKRLAAFLLTIFVVSLCVFMIMEYDPERVVVYVLGPYSTDVQRALWLENNGYNVPSFLRYINWVWDALHFDFGNSIVYNEPVASIVGKRLGNTAILGLVTFCVMVPLSLFLGIMAGVREGSRRDRVISVVSIFTTSVPEYASAILFSFVFVYLLGLLPGTSGFRSGFNIPELILPVMTLVIYATGYIARIQRASMIEVMNSQYIRTAVLKGLPYRTVIWRHAIRNALVAPYTVILLQLPWLLSGVIVVEYFFGFRGFGDVLLQAGLSNDVYLVEACALITVLVVLATQLLGDMGYWLLNPRLRRR